MNIYNYERKIKNIIEKLHNPISENNVNAIKEFGHYLISLGLSKARIENYLRLLKILAEKLKKDFIAANKEDIQKLVYEIENSDYSPHYKHSLKVALKRFYKWLLGNDEEYPEIVKWIKTTFKYKDFLLPEQLINEEEIKKLIDSCNNIRDKAFISLLYESGARIGEIGSLRIKDIEFIENYARINIKGKTGSRSIIIISSIPYLINWINIHPLKNNPNSPLFISLKEGFNYKMLSHSMFNRILKKAAKRAGINKRIHPHKLRHSRATFLANKLTEAQMNQIFGWKQGSRMPSIYVHLSGRDIDNAILKLYGIEKKEEKENKISIKICPRCNSINMEDAKYCMKCGLILDIKEAARIEEARLKADRILNELFKDNEFKELLIKKLELLQI